MKTKKIERNTKRDSRREFTKTIAATLVCAPLATTLAQAQTPTKTKEAAAPPNPQPAPAQDNSLPFEDAPVAQAYAEVARARFGKQVTPEQFEQIKKDLEGNVRVAGRLRAAKLKNGDEPDFVFNAE